MQTKGYSLINRLLFSMPQIQSLSFLSKSVSHQRDYHEAGLSMGRKY